MDRDAMRERDNLAAALGPLLGTIGFYIGPNARSGVSHEKVQAYERLRLAWYRAEGWPCHKCNDTGIWQEWKDGVLRPCPLRHERGHDVELPPGVIAYMTEQRDKDRAEDATSHNGGPHRVGPPRYETELAELSTRESRIGQLVR
jgi:hypothetical protein